MMRPLSIWITLAATLSLVTACTPDAQQEGLSNLIEDSVPAKVLTRLETLGHGLQVIAGWTATFGGAQIVYDPATGPLAAAADPRREAYALAYWRIT